MLIPNHSIAKEYFKRIIGEEGLKMMESISTLEGEITDEKIAKISNIKLTGVRRILYLLYESRIAEYRIERNDENGWLTYLWRFHMEKMKRIMEEEVEKVLRNLKTRLEYERKGVFYLCKCKRVLFENATLNNFRCDICGSNYDFFDNAYIIKGIEEKIAVIEKWKKKKKG